ncbi:MAG: hypothetical protein AAFO94_02920 [Bacteroidota bacterium]
MIDANRVTLDLYRSNNTRKLKGLLPGLEPIKFKWLAGLENPTRTNVYWTPLLAANAYDGAMLGLTFFNTVSPANKFEYRLTPLFGIRSGDLTGMLNLRYHLYPKKAIQQLTIGVDMRRFNYAYNERWDYFLNYEKIRASLQLELKKKPTNPVRQFITLSSNFLTEDLATFDTTGTFSGTEDELSNILELQYALVKNTVVNPFQLNIGLEYQQYNRNILDLSFNESYLKASLEMQTSYTYKEDRNVSLRLFAGYFLDNSRRNAGTLANRTARGSFALTSQGYNDYQYNDFFFGRTEREGLLSRQIMIREGGMKTAFGSSFKTGLSNDYIVAVNLKADLPQRLPLGLPLKPYFDIGYYHDAQPTGAGKTFQDQLLWSGGVALEFNNRLFDGPVLGIYFPIINSETVSREFNQINGNYWSRISFMLNLRAMDPWAAINRLF